MTQTTTVATKQITTPAKISITLTINGRQTQLNVAPWTTLLDALRDHLDLTGTKKAAITASAAPARCWSMDVASFPVSRLR